MTNEDSRKERVRARLERMWKFNEGILAGLDHQLIVMAVPTYPANIEAVSAMDMSDIADLLVVFTKEREKGNARPVEQVSTASDAPQGPIGRDFYDADGKWLRDPKSLGQGNDGGRTPEKRADAPAEPAQGHSPLDAMGSGSMLDPVGTPLREQGAVDTSDIPEADEEWFRNASVSRASHHS
jgi:hypothetical protein